MLPFRHFLVVIYIIMVLQQDIVMTVLIQLHQKNIKVKKHEANL